MTTLSHANRLRMSLALALAFASGLTACADSTPTTASETTQPRLAAAARAISAAGIRNQPIGVILSGSGANAVPVRIIGGAEQAAAIATANRLLALELARLATGVSPGGGDLETTQDAAVAAYLFSVAPTGAGSGTTTHTFVSRWGCTDNGEWEPIAVRVSNWKTEALPNSGGHSHDAGSKPLGKWSPTSGTTGDDGTWTSTFTAPEFAGEETLSYHVTGVTRCTGTATPSGTYQIQVGGLQALGTGTGYTLIGATSTHPDNHYGTPAFNSALQSLASTFHAKYSASLAYNDMSLVQGGRFDVSAGWGGSHYEHRNGRNVDMRTVTLTLPQLKFARLTWEGLGGSVHDETGTSAPHYHLRY